MSTEAVPYVSKYSNEEKELMDDYQSGFNKRYEIQPLTEYDNDEEREYLTKKNKMEIEENETVSSKENNDNCNNDGKKKRNNARKRNRSDMSPEELRKLRERERKAQQSRRDRIRAQKVILFFFVIFKFPNYCLNYFKFVLKFP